jgi:predicted nuclease of predicted toxin-antitoxin system
MRFLIDNCLSPIVAVGLAKAGYDARHVKDYDLESGLDEEIFALAANEGRVLISSDTDFGSILALRKEKRPSVILFHRQTHRRPEDHLSFLLLNLPALQKDLDAGAIVVFDQDRIRVRSLPVVE